MGRAYTRSELLVEVAAAATKLHEVGGTGDLRCAVRWGAGAGRHGHNRTWPLPRQ